LKNKNSNANHNPFRQCVICRNRSEKEKLLRFIFVESEIAFDINKKAQARGFYVCDNNECLNKIDKWKKKRLRKKINVRK